MDYEKKYKEAIELMKDCIPDADGLVHVRPQDIFPELEESEDERIRKAIHVYLDWLDGRKDYQPKGEYSIRDMIAWLEKQGEKKPAFEMKTPEESLGIDSETYNKIVDECIYGEQKPAEKVEPKFKVGDYIIDVQGVETNKIVGYEDDSYLIRTSCSQFYLPMKLTEKNYRLWSIADAKDGDVLVDEDNNIGIYKEIEGICWHSYIYLGCDGKLRGYSIGGSHEQTDTHPATKEQRDTLEKAITNAGYRWDKEKLKLEKI